MRTYRSRVGLTLAALIASIASTQPLKARAQAAAAASPGESTAGRVEFDHPGGGTPTVEVSLPAGLFGDVVGLGDAAIAGVAEGLLSAQTTDEETKAGVKLATDQLAAIRTIIASVQGALGEVRLRVYRGNSESVSATPIDATAVADHYAAKLDGSAWNKIVSAREGEKCATVFLMRDNGAIRGVFVVAAQGSRELVLVNVLCDISPERVKKITQQATSMGLELGGEEALKEILEEIRG